MTTLVLAIAIWLVGIPTVMFIVAAAVALRESWEFEPPDPDPHVVRGLADLEGHANRSTERSCR